MTRHEYKSRKAKLKWLRMRRRIIKLAVIVLLIILLTVLIVMSVYAFTKNNKNEAKTVILVTEKIEAHEVKSEATYSAKPLVIKTEEIKNESIEEIEICNQEFNWTDDEAYLLAKIAMAEAEGESYETKQYVVMCVLNRVFDSEFPNTIKEVIFQPKQFSPITNGRWDKVEPNEECWKVVNDLEGIQYPILSEWSCGCLYFENCVNENNWHSRNLKYLYTSDGIRFYK